MGDKKKEGHYAAFYKGYTISSIGGCIYWNQDRNNPKVFWTSRWWIYEDIRDIVVDFYNMPSADELEIVIARKKVKLIYPGIIYPGKILKGTLQMVLI